MRLSTKVLVVLVEFITTDCQFFILGNIHAYHWLCGFLLLSTIQLVS